MRSRNLLHKSKLELFKKWLVDNNWVIEETKGAYEVLRARHVDTKLPLLLYDRDNSIEHYTTEGVAYHMAKRFVRDGFYSSIPEDSMV